MASFVFKASRSWRIRSSLHDYEVVLGKARPRHSDRAELLSPDIARWLLNEWYASAPEKLREMYAALGEYMPTGLSTLAHAAHMERLLRRLEAALSTGKLVVWVLKPPAPDFTTRPRVRAPSGQEESLANHWVEIELLAEDGTPRQGERYRLELPGGALREGRLDARGLARFDGLREGICHVWFPDIDGMAWNPVSTRPAPTASEAPRSWVEFELLDENDEPLAREVYELQLPDGRRVVGRLDEIGRAFHSDVPSGTCFIDFPRLKTGTWGSM